jgi:hypothetical protein
VTALRQRVPGRMTARPLAEDLQRCIDCKQCPKFQHLPGQYTFNFSDSDSVIVSSSSLQRLAIVNDFAAKVN